MAAMEQQQWRLADRRQVHADREALDQHRGRQYQSAPTARKWVGTAMKWLMLVFVLAISACASVPKQTVLITTPDGKSYRTDAPKIADPRTHADGTRMDYVELAVVKANGGLPAPSKPAPQWACMAADAGTTVALLSTGRFAEANPLGIWVAPYSVGFTLWARHREKMGDSLPARWNARAHCFAAIWNAAWWLRWLVIAV